MDIYNAETRWDDFNDGEPDEGIAETPTDPDNAGLPAEYRRPRIPSSYGWKQCEQLGILAQAIIERRLRIAELDELLRRVRDLVSWRTHLYATDIRHGQYNYRQSTKSWKRVHQTTDSLKQVAIEYDQARAALLRLNPGELVKNRFKELQREDLKTIVGIYDPNVRGQRHKTLSWIWADIAPPAGDTEGRARFAFAGMFFGRQSFLLTIVNTLLVQRWNYLKTRAVRDRHWEELNILDREMYSVPKYMQFRAQRWTRIVQENTADDDEGLRCYARRQAAMWFKFANDAEQEFKKLTSSRVEMLGADSFVHYSRVESLSSIQPR